MSIYIINSVPQRYDFPAMFIPVVAKTDNCKSLLTNINNEEFLNKKIGLDSVNINWKNDGFFYCGPVTTLSEVISYNKIPGLDKTYIYSCTDSYEGFCEPIDDWPTTTCFLGSYESIDNKISEYSIDGDIVYDFDEAFEIGNKIMKSYPMRKGSFVNAYGLHNVQGHCFIGIFLLVPNKRDYDCTFIKIIKGDSKEEIINKFLTCKILADPENKKFKNKYISIFEVKEESVSVGFINAACHVVQFSYKNK